MFEFPEIIIPNPSSTMSEDRCCCDVLSHVRLFATSWTAAGQASLSMRFSRQEYWSRLLFPPPGYLPDPGIEPASLSPPALTGRFFTESENIWKCERSLLAGL